MLPHTEPLANCTPDRTRSETSTCVRRTAPLMCVSTRNSVTIIFQSSDDDLAPIESSNVARRGHTVGLPFAHSREIVLTPQPRVSNHSLSLSQNSTRLPNSLRRQTPTSAAAKSLSMPLFSKAFLGLPKSARVRFHHRAMCQRSKKKFPTHSRERGLRRLSRRLVVTRVHPSRTTLKTRPEFRAEVSCAGFRLGIADDQGDVYAKGPEDLGELDSDDAGARDSDRARQEPCRPKNLEFLLNFQKTGRDCFFGTDSACGSSEHHPKRIP